MANKTTEPTVTRITANDKKKSKTAKIIADQPVKNKPKRKNNPLRPVGDYFKGAWHELRQVRWPDRKATWSMTLALICFTAFFAIFIILLDAGFKYLFELMLG